MDLSKTYDPKSFEDEIYKEWEDGGYFKANADSKKPPYTIVIPPPNITGQLHIGHALDDTLQDTMIRFKRMQGYEALWIPGTDHASIATEVKIVEQMQKEGHTKQSLGRDGFMERAFLWKEKYGGKIVAQLKKMGFSCDWSRLAFTMDERCSKAVKHVFVKLYEKGLIYQGNRIINWCPCCKTAISDAEVEYEEDNSLFWHLKYPIKGSKDFITVATTRPETMLGDTAVAVNPSDKRYKKLIGKTLILPLVNKEIPIIADDYVDLEFGSGAVKITPAHDPNDFEVGLRHNLEVVRVMNDDGTMNARAGKYEGLDRFEARVQIVADLEAAGLLEKIQPHAHNVGHCYRCHTVIEPIVSKQWFVKMQPLAEPAIKAVKTGKTKFVPERFEKIYFNWMENIKDWCISRQLWWGHRIPAYYCDKCGATFVSESELAVCEKCGGALRQDEDVLDTWFSSALWPFSTLGYPEKTKDLEFFYPTNVLITAYDIIFFWVARMIFSGIEHMGEVPFKDVLIHGIVRDSQGRKMSKSLGNGIDPIEIIDKYGADTLRFYLMFGVSAGSDMRFSEKKMEGIKFFMNKIWNASRFVLMNLDGASPKPITEVSLTLADKWILHKFNDAVKEVTQNIEKYEFGNAENKLYDFVWSDFCDWYIELIKPVLYGGSDEQKNDTLSVLKYVFTEMLKLLHPFIPFITEKIYSQIGGGEVIMTMSYPTFSEDRAYGCDYEAMTAVMELIAKVRSIRQEMNVSPAKQTKMYLRATGINISDEICSYLKKLAFASDVVVIANDTDVVEKNVSIITHTIEAYLPLGELIDYEKEVERLNGEREKVEKEIEFCLQKLSNVEFSSKAPAQVVDNIRQKLEKNRELLTAIEQKIAAL